MDYKKDITDYFNREKMALDAISKEDLNEFMNVLVSARDQGKQIFIMGNGGSAATASHYVCDFNKGVSENSEKQFKFICLNDNIPMMMAYANDNSYADIFVKPLKNYFKEGDIVIGISGSGNSENVVRAIDFANINGGITVGITGFSGGKLKEKCKYNVHVPIDDMQITEDIHMVVDHCIMKILCKYE